MPSIAWSRPFAASTFENPRHVRSRPLEPMLSSTPTYISPPLVFAKPETALVMFAGETSRPFRSMKWFSSMPSSVRACSGEISVTVMSTPASTGAKLGPEHPWRTLGARRALEVDRPPRPCFRWLRGLDLNQRPLGYEGNFGGDSPPLSATKYLKS